MNEDLRRCLKNMHDAMEEIKTMGGLKISELKSAKEEYGLSDEMVRLIFCLK